MPHVMIKLQSLVYPSRQLGIISLRLLVGFSFVLSLTLSFSSLTTPFPFQTLHCHPLSSSHTFTYFLGTISNLGGTHITSISEHLTWIQALALNSFSLNHSKELGLREEKVLAHLKSIFLSPSCFLGVGSSKLPDQITLMLFLR